MMVCSILEEIFPGPQKQNNEEKKSCYWSILITKYWVKIKKSECPTKS